MNVPARHSSPASFAAALFLVGMLAAVPTASADPLIPRPVPAAERLLASTLPPQLDGRLLLAYRLGRDQGPGPDGGLHPLLGRSVSPAGIQVTLQFADAPERALFAAAEQLGCALSRLPKGEIASVGPVVEARCAWEALESVARLPGMVRVSPTFDYRPIPPQAAPVNRVASEVEAVALREKARPLGRGKGVVVADIDSGFDPFHPMFFRADGGAFAWIDVNQNGKFDPGVDAVDFNRNGLADPGETLRMIKAPIYWFYGTPGTYNASGAFVAGVDWLFQDENGDGIRNQGKFAPYGDQKPTYGEQLYVVDDVNGNGLLDLNERVVRLHTPKVKAALSEDQNGTVRVYRRGVDLSHYPSLAPREEMHGTMVMGTIGGGDPRYMRYAGIAPDVELLLGSSRSSSLVSTLAWARSEGAHIVLWEMATWYMEHLDGSSALEVACDSASNQGVLQVGAAGNLGGSQKHRVKTHPTGTEVIPLVLPTNQAQYVIGNFNWRGGSSAALSFTMQVNGVAIPFSGNSGSAWAGNHAVYWGKETSPRGTHMVMFYIYSQNWLPIAAQTVEFTVANTGPSVQLHGYVSDSASSWNKLVHWPLSTGATDLGTYGTPGTGDKTMAVGTMFLDFIPDGEVSGTLAGHSGQGPRIDGLDTVDLVAPEDHITGFSWYEQNSPFGAYMVGGGTSNSSPVLVGLAALLRELHPGETPAQLGARLRQYAHVEPQMGAVPNDRWGHGKARVHRAHYSGAMPLLSLPPVASGTAKRMDMALELDASASTDPEGEALRYYWDVNYDGTWDYGPMDAAKFVGLVLDANLSHVKLEVVDPHGRTGAALVAVTAGPVNTDGGSGDGGQLPDGGQPDAGDGGQLPDGGQPDAGDAGGADGGKGSTYYAQPHLTPELGPEAGGCGCQEASPVTLAPLLGLALLALRRRRRHLK